MLTRLFFILLICHSYIGFAQNFDFEMIGFLIPQEGDKITYKLAFNEKEDGTIEGISITDFNGQHSTTSSISGKFGPNHDYISFKELSNVSTTSDLPDSTFCFIQVEKLPLQTVMGKTIIRGNFQGVYMDGSFCAEGRFELIGAGVLEALKAANEQRDSLKQVEKVISELVDFRNELETAEILQSGSNVVFSSSGKEVVLMLWDGLKQDNDRVHVFINGQLKYKDFLIVQEKRMIKIPIEDNGTEIKIVASDEGESPPNTVNLILLDGLNARPMQTRMRKNESAVILIKPN